MVSRRRAKDNRRRYVPEILGPDGAAPDEAPADLWVALDVVCQGSDEHPHGQDLVWRFFADTHAESGPPQDDPERRVMVRDRRRRVPYGFGPGGAPARDDAGRVWVPAYCHQCDRGQPLPLDWIAAQLGATYAVGARGVSTHQL